MGKVYSRLIRFLFSVVIGVVFLIPNRVAASDSNSSFWIEYIDVGQGDSALIQCDGHYMMIDGGPSDASSTVYTILKNKQIKKLDYMIATHPDADHIGGLSGALNYATVGKCYSPVTTHDTKTFNSLVKYLGKQNLTLTVPKAGETFALGSANIQIIGPIYKNADSNNNSIVTKVTYGKNTFIFMGDAEKEEESSILSSRYDLSCDVLKVGHHGSSSSSSSSFIKRLAPKYAVLSVEKKNSYGHPTADTLNTLIQNNITIYRTDLQGDIICTSDGKSVTFTTEKNAKAEDMYISGDNLLVDGKGGSVEVANAIAATVPSGTTYVLNTSSKKIHLTTCGSVRDMSEKNTSYSTKTAEQLVSEGYAPCKRCNPTVSSGSIEEQSNVIAELVQTPSEVIGNYVLNTNSKKFHYLYCSSVGDMSAKNRKDVNLSREEIIAQGYVPCKRCNP